MSFFGSVFNGFGVLFLLLWVGIYVWVEGATNTQKTSFFLLFSCFICHTWRTPWWAVTWLFAIIILENFMNYVQTNTVSGMSPERRSVDSDLPSYRLQFHLSIVMNLIPRGMPFPSQYLSNKFSSLLSTKVCVWYFSLTVFISSFISCNT